MPGNFEKALKSFAIAATAAGLVTVVPAQVLAHGGGGGGAGGMSASHMSSTGLMNSNGPNAADRDFGIDRAQDRMSTSGTAHSKGASHASSQAGGSSTTTTNTTTTSQGH